MMRYKKAICILVCMLTMLVLGCEKEPLKGLKYDVPGMPAIESFSGVEYEDYKYIFPPVLSVVYKHDGIEEVISADDPRVIRLVNSLAYSFANRLDGLRYELIREEVINTYLAIDVPMLEISFDLKEDREEKVLDIPKIVICGDSYLMFADMTSPGVLKGEGQLAEWYRPYKSLQSKLVHQGILTEEEYISQMEWGDSSWIDLLEYAGFSE